MASPVLFISGPSSLFTPGNLSKENTGSLIAKPLSFLSKVKFFNFFAQHYFGRNIQIWDLICLGNEWVCSGCTGICFNNKNLIVFYGKLNIYKSLNVQFPCNFSAYSSMVCTINGDKLNGGNTALLSPL